MRVADLKIKAERLGFELMVFNSDEQDDTGVYHRTRRYHLHRPGAPFRTDINSYTSLRELEKRLDEEEVK